MGWQRDKSLDRLCKEQRMLQLSSQNANFRGRKISVVDSYYYHLKQGKSKEDAYYEASKSQLISIVPKWGMVINIDARTSWTLEIEGT